jgi:hypothetical protein
MNDRDSFVPDDDIAKAQELASRYRCEFVDLRNVELKLEIFRRVPADLIFRYSFVPLEEMDDGRLAIAIADPAQLMLLDEIGLLLGKRLTVRVTPLAQINEILRGIDPDSKEMVAHPPDEPWRPSDPDVCIRAPKKPRPHLRSGTAKAVPEEQH